MRKKTEEKRQTIVEAAKDVFRERGYETSSVSDIASRAGASKATVYSYFPSKEALFMEVILEAGQEHGEAAFSELVASESLTDGLRRLGERHLTFISTPEALALARLAIMEGERSTLGREFYERGPGMLIERLAEYLDGAAAKGLLRREDPRWMAEHLKSLYEAGITERRLFGSGVQLEPREVHDAVARAVDIFLNYYGTPG
jgi:AcrR family transcriptional regulator